MYPNDEAKFAVARDILQRKSRDNARTPVQWSSAPNAGFTSPDSKPWMRVNDDYPTVNAEAQLANPTPAPGQLSVHAFWKRGLEKRKEHKDVFVYGDFEIIDPDHDKVVAFRRWNGNKAFLVVLNFSGETVQWEGLGSHQAKRWVAGTYDERQLQSKNKSGTIELRPWEGLLGIA